MVKVTTAVSGFGWGVDSFALAGCNLELLRGDGTGFVMTTRSP